MRLNQLTFTRFIAALSIIVFHYGKEIFPFNIKIISFLFVQANVGVSYFFILSGFVMMVAYGNKPKIPFFDYIKRRFARIYPVYFLAILLLLLSCYLKHAKINLVDLLYNTIMIQAWIPGKALTFNTPGWSLSVELFFYLSFPILINNFYSKFKTKTLLISIILIFVSSQFALHWFVGSNFYHGYPSKSHDFIYYFPLMHFNEFLMGNIAGLIFIKKKRIENFDYAILGFVILLVLALKYSVGIIFHNGMLAFIFLPIIILLSANNGIISQIFRKKYLVFLGEISYGMYILQKPIFDGISGILKRLDVNNKFLVFYSCLLILTVVSALSYKYLETPLRRKINNIQLPKILN